MKFKSARLKEYNYNINVTFDEAFLYGEIVALADNQILRSIRNLYDRKLDLDYVESLYKKRDSLRKNALTMDNLKMLKEIIDEINNQLFVPEYITVEIEHPSHYKYMFENGLLINGKKFNRFSCSAGQARLSTIVMCEEVTAEKLNVVLNNGRDLSKKLTPSKFNAYFGLAGSATIVVSTPSFCVVPDYKSEKTFKANFVTETDWNKDDIIDERMITEIFNRTDGCGLISYEKAKEWSEELGLDYVPAQWCIRQNFIKGSLVTFDIHRFCETENNGSFIINSIYKDANGEPIKIDLKSIDVIITESMFKLWDSFDSLEQYKQNCINNKLYWGVAIHTPKEDKDVLKMNYQFLQTLNLRNPKDIEQICKKFVDWICGVNADDLDYTLLFLIGRNPTKEKINDYLKSSNNHWVKSLILDHSLINDKYIKTKIYDLIKKRIKRGCLGEIITDGNFQVIVSDPYAMMQHVCGQKVTGFLGENEYYSNYWNKKGVNVVSSARSPLTYRSEHLKLNLVKNDKTESWYNHCYTGIIVNVHGSETVNWAGSDFDYDIIATTSDPTVIRSIYKNELPVTYSPPKPTPIGLTEESLYQADLFAFGSAIGSITNKSTSGYALLPMFEEDSKEYETIMNRLKMCTKLQNAQIDKAKIGRKVKGIPDNWMRHQRVNENDPIGVVTERNMLNKILVDKHPYFFIYLYKDTKNRYNKYKKSRDITCVHKFGMTFNELQKKTRKTNEEREFIKICLERSPVIESDCVMNNLCRYIESVDFSIKKRIHFNHAEDVHKKYLKDENLKVDAELIEKLNSVCKDTFKRMQNDKVLNHVVSPKDRFEDEVGRSIEKEFEKFKSEIELIASDIHLAVDHLVKLFYVEHPSYNKELLWNTFGDILCENVKGKRNISSPILFPIPDESGNIQYLNKKYKLCEVSV